MIKQQGGKIINILHPGSKQSVPLLFPPRRV
ncbi:MAG: hypothetical protein CM15mP120_09580 [Pseudomonadota bacterium]|nr:MAG: hypothetical protein CM15mP120_09580 [Pseudomonadota bacterium]